MTFSFNKLLIAAAFMAVPFLVFAQKPDSILLAQLQQKTFPFVRVVWAKDRFVCVEQADKRRGLIATDGKIIQKPNCEDLYVINAGQPFPFSFTQNFIKRDFDSKKMGMIDTAGNEILPQIFDEIEEVTDYYGEYAPLYRCKTSGLWAIFNLQGKQLTEAIFKNTLWQPEAPEVVLVQTADNNWQTMRLDAQYFGDGPYTSLKVYANGILVSKAGEGFGFLRHDGTALTALKYRDGYGFRDAEDADKKAREIGLPEHLTLLGNLQQPVDDYVWVWIDSEGGEHLIKK